MNILLAAYEFPPLRSPQAIRWQALTRELVGRGHHVTVLTALHSESLPTSIDEGVDVMSPGGSEIVRTPAEPVNRALFWLRALTRGIRSNQSPAVVIPRDFQGLNWKGRIVAAIGRIQNWALFPDGRARWNATALPALKKLLDVQRPDLVITSHEPASVLALGLCAFRAGVPWAADLGDPVDASYLPLRWRWRARQLEREVCRHSCLVSVTTDSYARKLQREHGLDVARSIVIRQGFSPFPPHGCLPPDDSRGERLELLYTGQLYSFRSPRPLLDALRAIEGVRLTVLSPQAGMLRSEAALLGGRLRLMSPVSPEMAVKWQRRADVLVNLGNTMPLQIPGKLFEYLGSRRPVLHIAACDPDESSDLVGKLRCGWVVSNDPDAIRDRLGELHSLWRAGRLDHGLDLTEEAVLDFSWPVVGGRLSDALVEAVERENRKLQA